MKKRMFFIWCLPCALGSCVPGMLSVTSTPEKADVHAVNSIGTKRTLGKTPLDIPVEEVFGPNDESARLVIQKPGMYRESVIMPRSSLPNNHKIHVTLKELEKVEIEKIVGKECEDQTPATEEEKKEKYQCPSSDTGDFTKLARGVATIQSLIAKKELRTAELQVNSLITDYPYVAVLHTLLGNVGYLSKNFRMAHSAYSRALELDPENVETRKILLKLSKLVTPLPEVPAIDNVKGEVP